MAIVSEGVMADLVKLDTPTVCNALEVVAVERRGYGYTVEPLVCLRPKLPPMVGYARTVTIRAAHPNHVRGDAARKLMDDYYAYVFNGPKPGIMVIQDLDDQMRGYGSFWGEVNSNLHRGLGCLGVITDGSIRDLNDIADGFQMLANRIGPSHGYVHVVDFGRPVTVAGMRVSDGDLLHADQHGAVVVPANVADKLSAAAAQIVRRERVMIDASKEPGFNLERLRRAQGDAAEVH